MTIIDGYLDVSTVTVINQTATPQKSYPNKQNRRNILDLKRATIHAFVMIEDTFLHLAHFALRAKMFQTCRSVLCSETGT